MNTRNWSIRSKIVALVAVPLAALLALWLFATALTVGPAIDLLSARTMLEKVNRPGENLVAELQRERRLSLVYLAREGDGVALGQQRTRTDSAASTFRREVTSEAVRDAAGDLLLDRINETITALESLPAGRGFIDRREVDRPGALGLFSGVIDSAFKMFGAATTQEDPAIAREARALTLLGRAREVLGQSDSLLAGAMTAGRFGDGEHAQFVQIVGTQRYLYADAVSELPQRDRAAYQRLTEGSAFVQLRQMQDQLIATGRDGATVGVDNTQWQSAYESAVEQVRDFETTTSDALAGRSAPVAVNILVRLGLAGVLGLTTLLVSIVISVRVGRSLVRRLGSLRGDALQLAKQRLPDVVDRLRRGEDVDVVAEAPDLAYGSDEIGQLGHAFTEVQRTAVQSAVDEAAVRRGLNEVFLNIARRSQTLLHRQLALLDRMERRSTEPEELEDLFRVDHLATRMRRHAEDLVILAGATPGRGWRNPVPFVDVVRGAVSEVEDYQRIDAAAVAGASLAGRAVGDVIHLLAELLENATSFSPPHTRVQVTGQVVPNGFAIEIEDRGLGMAADAIDEANRRLAEPPDFDPGNSARLGLFVVAQLGRRHDVRVRLRSSPYGGVTAVVLIPTTLVVAAGPAALAAGPAPDEPVAFEPVPYEVTQGARAAAVDPRWPAAEPATVERDLSAVPAPALVGVPVPTGLDRRRRTAPRLSPVPTPPSAVADSPRAAGAAVGRFRPPPGAPPGVPTAHPAGPAPEPARSSAVPPAVPPPSAPRPPASIPVQPGPGADRLGRVRPEAAPARVVDAPAAQRPPIGEDGLPRRIRQSHLNARLREPATATPAAPDPGSGVRSPEQVRSLMNSLQAGTVRGRLAATGGPPGGAVTGNGGAGGGGQTAPSGNPNGHRPPGDVPEAAQPPPAADRHTTGQAPAGWADGAAQPTGWADDAAQPSSWFTDSRTSLAWPSVGTGWADRDTADYPQTGRPPAPDGGPYAGPVASPTGTRDGSTHPSDAAGVVHHGEILPRFADEPAPPGSPSVWPSGSTVAQPPAVGGTAHPERDA